MAERGVEVRPLRDARRPRHLRRDAATAAALRARLRAAGLRSTAPRLAVLACLDEAKAPLSHADLSEELAGLGLDRATIYRNLTDLAEAGLATRLELGDHVWRFESRSQSGEGAEHAHFVCSDCGGVACLPDFKVDLRSAKGGRRLRVGTVSDVLLRGRCEAC